MIRLLYLLPFIMSVLWLIFLRYHQIPLKQGLRGFMYIAAFNAVLALILWGLIILTNQQTL